MDTVVFDLDGTLADTSADLIAAANSVFAGLGHGSLLDPMRDCREAYRGVRHMLRIGFGRLGAEAEAERAIHFDRVMEAYGAALDIETRLYPGAAGALEELRVRGYVIAVCTNKLIIHAEAVLRALGVREYFGAVIASDSLPVRKPDPLPLIEAVRLAGGWPTRAILVGDTDTDRDTARNANMPCVLITFGPDGRAVEALAPAALLDHYDSLPDLADRLLRDVAVPRMAAG
jgi:phosphoglycolate phosphatase